MVIDRVVLRAIEPTSESTLITHLLFCSGGFVLVEFAAQKDVALQAKASSIEAKIQAFIPGKLVVVSSIKYEVV